MDCLVAHKKHHEMNPACRAGVEHKQIVSIYYNTNSNKTQLCDYVFL